MDELIADFLVEANESLEIVDVELVRFEASPEDREALDKIFRLVHTLKGACGFLGLGRLEAIAHAAETLLGRFRDGRLEVSREAVTLVLRSIDRIKEIIEGLAAAGVEPAGEDRQIIAKLEALCSDRPLDATSPEPAARPLRPGEVSEAELEAAFAAAAAPVYGDPPPQTPSAHEGADEPSGEDAAPPVPSPALHATEPSAGEASAAAQGQSIRVGVDVLEDMMTLVSELVLTRNQLLQINRGRTDDAFSPPLQRLSTITGELQDSVMKTRMQPIGAAWKKLPRLVRELSNDLGKKIELALEGEATELDRQVLELVRDPLTHMVRNAADHGLETPEARRAAGKPETGVIRLSAFHEGGSIVIRLTDDGRGLDTARIRDKAVEKGLLARAEADAMSDAQAHRIIFLPGFSTAAAVTNVSGRGVGMDVVRTNIEQIGGQIELHSVKGHGSTFTIKIPLTLAIISALIVGVGGERFAVPQAAVLELVKVGSGEHRIETIETVRLVRLREELIPLLDLGGLLGREGAREPSFVMVMQVGPHRFGVMVDEVIDTEEIVVKPLAAVLRHLPVFSGATILGDGSVVLIVDPNGMAASAGDMAAAVEKSAEAEADSWEAVREERRTVLLVRVGDQRQKAVELSRVTRLEHADARTIQRDGRRASMEYRGKLMPILRIEEGQTLRSEGVQPLLVFTGMLYAMGLAVDQILDVIETPLVIELNPSRPGILGTALVAGKATDILDVDHFMVDALAEHARTADKRSGDGRAADTQERQAA